MTRRAVATARRIFRAVERRQVPDALRGAWRDYDEVAGMTPGWRDRLDRDRIEIIPWLHRTRPLVGVRVLEVGAGEGTACLALAEQGAIVTGVDVDAEALQRARQMADAADVAITYVEGNANQLSTLVDDADWVVFWASLEHMTVSERVASLSQAWDILPAGGLLTVVETPNRLWPFDSHTSQLPFYSWLPDDLAFRYARLSPRRHFGGDTYHDADAQMLHFLRRGRGLSYHEIELAFGAVPAIVNCMQLERRRRFPLRAVAWRMSSAGRTERSLRRFAPAVDRSWFQPFVYITMRKP